MSATVAFLYPPRRLCYNPNRPISTHPVKGELL